MCVCCVHVHACVCGCMIYLCTSHKSVSSFWWSSDNSLLWRSTCFLLASNYRGKESVQRESRTIKIIIKNKCLKFHTQTFFRLKLFPNHTWIRVCMILTHWRHFWFWKEHIYGTSMWIEKQWKLKAQKWVKWAERPKDTNGSKMWILGRQKDLWCPNSQLVFVWVHAYVSFPLFLPHTHSHTHTRIDPDRPGMSTPHLICGPFIH